MVRCHGVMPIYLLLSGNHCIVLCVERLEASSVYTQATSSISIVYDLEIYVNGLKCHKNVYYLD